MKLEKKSFELYGIDNISKIIDEVIKEFNLTQDAFELKLIMIELISNAFVHGNNRNVDKPISVKVELKDNYILISVRDCGKRNKKIIFEQYVHNEQQLLEHGRGIFFIKTYSDKLEFKDNTIIVRKNV